MRRLVATGLALGATAAFATPANAATAVDLRLWSNYQPVTISVNGKGVVVNGLYDSTPVRVALGGKVTLSAPKVVDGLVFCGWLREGIATPTRTVTIHGDWRDSYYTDYAREC